MQVGRDQRGGAAVVALTVDSAIPPGVLAEIAAEIGAETAQVVDLSED
jgi:D-3-phosphoglycerate dehydrogenase